MVCGDSFENLVSKKYLEYTETSLEEMKATIKKLKLPYEVKNVSVIEAGLDNIYSGDIVSGNETLRVNFVETFPYEFYLTFGSFYNYTSSSTHKGTQDDISVIVNDIYQDMEYVEYELKIQNDSKADINIDLTLSSNAYIVMEDETKEYLSKNFARENVGEILANSSSIVKVRFDINVQNQRNIDKLVIDNIKVNGKSKNISVQL